MELLAGTANLTREMRRLGLRTREPADISSADRKSFQLQFDILKPEHFRKLCKLLKTGQIRWVHMAPPCGTLSSARRKDKHGYAAPLRSKKHPEGQPREELEHEAITMNPSLPPEAINKIVEQHTERVKEANEIVRRTTKLARVQIRMGQWFSIENTDDIGYTAQGLRPEFLYSSPRSVLAFRSGG